MSVEETLNSTYAGLRRIKLVFLCVFGGLALALAAASFLREARASPAEKAFLAAHRALEAQPVAGNGAEAQARAQKLRDALRGVLGKQIEKDGGDPSLMDLRVHCEVAPAGVCYLVQVNEIGRWNRDALSKLVYATVRLVDRAAKDVEVAVSVGGTLRSSGYGVTAIGLGSAPELVHTPRERVYPEAVFRFFEPREGSGS